MSSKNVWRRGVVLSACAAVAAGAVVATTQSAQAANSSPNTGVFSLAWSKLLNDPGKPIGLSSPSVATLDGGGPAVIVGDRAGNIYANHLSNGSAVPGWPVHTGGVAVDSTASVIGSGPSATVYVGVGNSANPALGGYLKITAQGRIAWYAHPAALPAGRGGTVGVQSSLAIGNLQGRPAVIAGAMGQEQLAIDAATGSTLRGFPWFQADTNFSTPALADLYGTGRPMIIEGGDSTAGLAFERNYGNGGHLRILSPTGNTGSANPSSGLFCSFDTNQVVQSSPAVGKILAHGRTGITFGTGTYYGGASSTNLLVTVDDRCHKVWSADLGGSTGSSPALADNLGTGELNVIEGVKTAAGGAVYALHGSNGAKIWRTNLPGLIFGSVTTLSLNGVYQDILAPTTAGLFVLDGRTGHIVSRIWTNSYMAMQNSPLVTVDPDGSVGLTIAGYKLNTSGSLVGEIQHYRVARAPASQVNAAGSWPMFHHDTHLTGNASLAQPSATTARYTADTAVTPAAALVPERGAATERVCLSGGGCLTAHVEGRTSTAANDFGAYGYAYGAFTVDPRSAGAANVVSVSANSMLFGTTTRWLTHSKNVVRSRWAASIATAGAGWLGGCNTEFHVRMQYTVNYANGTHVTRTLLGPAFRGFHC